MLCSTAPDVLIVGAGPTGLTAALEAIRHGLSVRVIDQNPARSIHSKALVVHSRTLEIFQDMGLASCVLNNGRKFDALNIHTPDRRLARIVFEELDWQDAIFPFWLSIPQSETERCLEEHFNALGGFLERGTELIDLEQFPDFARVRLKHRDDLIETVEVPWVVGCDGARSRTRKLLGLEMIGKADDHVFILGDIRIGWDVPEGEGINILSPDGIVLIVPMPQPKRYRIIAHMPKLTISDMPHITLDCLQGLVNQRTNFEARLSNLTWSSVFSSKHFVVSHHRQGRVFMAGDAAHIHSPVGGQGLNSGIQDAYNLMWKLALVQKGKAWPKLLDSYTAERHETAEDLIAGVGMATKILTVKYRLAQKVRDQLAGVLLHLDPVRNQTGRNVAMLDIKYQAGPAVAKDLLPTHGFMRWLNINSNGLPKGPFPGMRAPNVMLSENGNVPGNSLFDLFHGTQHTLLIFSGLTESPDFQALVELSTGIQLQYQAQIRPYIISLEQPPALNGGGHFVHDSDSSIHRAYAARQPSLYLIRPDKYVGYRSRGIDQSQLSAYLDSILVPSLVLEE
jgi:6-methylpretetramide 4-monooxygenase / 4-hydroxy-6-methylpretetramide 12a-monooxygenase